MKTKSAEIKTPDVRIQYTKPMVLDLGLLDAAYGGDPICGPGSQADDCTDAGNSAVNSCFLTGDGF